MPELSISYSLPSSALASITSSVQFGFIIGTLLFAIMGIADRFSPSRVFFISAVLASLSNLALLWDENTLISLQVFRFGTGFFLAGIYPVGMKIASDYFQKGLGTSLGFLVGALVLGTASPHLLKDLTENFDWSLVIITTSSLAAFGGALMLIGVPNGPFRTKGFTINLLSFFTIFKKKDFRNASMGYFGHMWELYTFWAFVPIMLSFYQTQHLSAEFNVPLFSFGIIAIGSAACIIAGYVSRYWGEKRTALLFLSLSGVCCLLFPFIFLYGSAHTFVLFLFIWGVVVIADSPLFSTLVAQNTIPQMKGTALTIVNSVGFLITIVSIQWVGKLLATYDSPFVFTILGIGPLLGLLANR